MSFCCLWFSYAGELHDERPQRHGAPGGRLERLSADCPEAAAGALEQLGLREPLAPIKPLAARGAVKAALAPPDNKAAKLFRPSTSSTET